MMLSFGERAAIDQLRPELRLAILELTVKSKQQQQQQTGSGYWAQVVEIAHQQSAVLTQATKNRDPTSTTSTTIHFVDPNVPASLIEALDRFTHSATQPLPATDIATPLGDAFAPVLEFLDRHVLDVSLYRFAVLRFFFTWLERAAALTASSISSSKSNSDYTYAELIKLQTKPGVVATFLDRTTRLISALETSPDSSSSSSSSAGEIAALTRLRQHLLQQEQQQEQQQQMSFEELVAHSQEQMLGWLLTAAAVGVAAAAAGAWLYVHTDGRVLSMSLKDLAELYRETKRSPETLRGGDVNL